MSSERTMTTDRLLQLTGSLAGHNGSYRFPPTRRELQECVDEIMRLREQLFKVAQACACIVEDYAGMDDEHAALGYRNIVERVEAALAIAASARALAESPRIPKAKP